MSSSSVIVLGLILVTWAGTCHPAYMDWGDCPQVTGQPTFDLDKFLGAWYVYQRFPNVLDTGLTCMFVTLTRVGNEVYFTARGRHQLSAFGNDIDLENMASGTVTIPDQAYPSDTRIKLNGCKTCSLVIRATDYTNYAVVFSCRKYVFFHIQSAWIVTRTPGVAPPNLESLRQELSAPGVDVTKLETMDGAQCPQESI